MLSLRPNHTLGVANDVSDQGIAVGESAAVVFVGPIPRVVPEAVAWSGATPTRLSDVATGGGSLELRAARRINERGQILGQARDAATLATRGFVFENGVVTDIGALRSNGNTEAFDLSERGQVVGASDVLPGEQHAFLWEQGRMTDLHDAAVILGRRSSARAINEFGVIVGSADFIDDPLNFQTAAVWDHGQILNLGVLGGRSSDARVRVRIPSHSSGRI